MRYLILFFCITITGTVTAIAGLPADSTWKLEKDKDGIKVYTRKVEGLGFKEFKAMTTIKAPIPVLLKLVMDVEAYPQWVYNIKTSELLKTINDNTNIYYNEIKVPWPLSNRDNIINATIIRNPDTNIVKVPMKGLPDFIPEKPGLVRIPKAKGLWVFTPHENGKTEVVLQYMADPGGSVPTWIVNMFVVDAPYNTLKNMKEFVKKEKYRSE